MLTASNDRTARLWGITSGKQYAVLRHRSLVTDARFSSDSSRVVTASYDQTAQVWDASSGEAITPPLEHRHHVMSARFSLDGRRVITASEDGTARIWDAQTGEEVVPPLRHADLLIGAAFHPDGEQVVTATHAGLVRQWRIAGEDKITPLQRHGSFVVDVDLTADGQRMATASQDNTARIWDVETGRPLTPPLRHDATVKSVQFSPDGTQVATASLDFTVRLWDARTGQPLTPPLSPAGWSEFTRNEFQDRARAVFSPDGRLIAGGFGSFAERTGIAVVWNAETGEVVGAPMPHDGRLVDLRFSPDGARLATADLEKKARIWDVEDGVCLVEIAHHGSVHSVRFSPDGNVIVTASGSGKDGEARVWDSTTGESVTPPMKHQGSVEVATFSPDGRKVATSSYDHTARIWDAETGKPITTPIPHGDQVRYIEFSPNGQYILTCGWGMYFDDVPLRGVRVWDAKTGQPVTPLPLKHANTAIARFRDDSQAVAVAATRERGGKLWKLEPDQRPLEDWVLFARLLSGQTIDSTDSMTPAEIADIVSIHDSLQAAYPREFGQSPDQRLERLRVALNRCIATRQWGVAKSYLETLRKAGPTDTDLRRLANEIAWAILNGPDVEKYDNDDLLSLASFAIPEARRAAREPIEWTVLTPLSIRSTGGAALSVQQDSSILVAGENPKSDSYLIICDTDLEGVTGLKLEALLDDSLPNNGPGRHPSGHFVVSEVSLQVSARSEDSEPLPVALLNASSEFNQEGWLASAAIDRNDLTGWSVAPQRGAHHVVFELEEAITHQGGSRLTIQIDSRDPIRFMHNLGRFRLLATTALPPLDVEQFIARKSGEGAGSWTTLALAQIRCGDAGDALHSLEMSGQLNEGGSIYDWLLEALAHWQLENDDAALAAFDRADAWLSAHPTTDPIRRLTVAALAHRAAGDSENATWPIRRSNLLFELGRDEEALTELSRAIELDESGIELLKKRGTWFARRSRWAEAADDYQKIAATDSTDHFNAYLVLSLLFHAGRVDEYRTLRSRVLEQFGDTADVRIAERIGKACLLDPDVSDAEAAVIHGLTEYAVTQGERSRSAKWFHAAAALSDYRTGQFDEALSHTARARRLARSTDPSLTALTHLINAMCEFHQERTDAATRSLESARQILTHTAADPKDGELPSDWYNWVICQVLEKEARELIGSQSSQ